PQDADERDNVRAVICRVGKASLLARAHHARHERWAGASKLALPTLQESSEAADAHSSEILAAPGWLYAGGNARRRGGQHSVDGHHYRRLHAGTGDVPQ